jgi:hypothetical protein
MDVVGEDALPVDLDDGQPLAVARLELWIAADVDLGELDALGRERPARALAEVTARGGVEDDPGTHVSDTGRRRPLTGSVTSGVCHLLFACYG